MKNSTRTKLMTKLPISGIQMPSSAAGYATPIASSRVIAITTGSQRIASVGATA